MYLTVDIPDDDKAVVLAKFQRTIPFIESVEMEDPSILLTDEDWTKPGRPATDAELEELAAKMEQEKGGISTPELRKQLSDRMRKYPYGK